MKVGEKMLQTPINVYPSLGEVMNAENPAYFEFTFQGDLLTFVQGQVVDMDYHGNPDAGTNDYVAWYNMPSGGHMSAVHNGQLVSYTDDGNWMKISLLKDGGNYKHRMRLFQHYPDSMPSNLAKRPLADMYYARGKIYDNPEGVSPTSSQAVIAPNLTTIKPPYLYTWDYNGSTHTLLLGAQYMDILHRRCMIYSYDSSTGLVTFKRPIFDELQLDGNYTALEVIGWEDDVVSDGYHQVGTAYKIYTNYLETGWYDFKYRTKPTITGEINPTTEWSQYATDAMAGVECGVNCVGTYSQAVGVGLKWYQYNLYAVDAPFYTQQKSYKVGDLTTHEFKLYKCKENIPTAGSWNSYQWQEVNIEDYGTLVDESERIYSYDLVSNFPTHPFLYGYGIKLTVCTQDDDTQTISYIVGRYTSESVCEFSNVEINDTTYTVDSKSQKYISRESIIKLEWSALDRYVFCVFRREVYRDGTVNPNPVYLGNVVTTMSDEVRRFTFYDYTAGNNQHYQYEIVVKSGLDNLLYYGKPLQVHYIYNVYTDWQGWAIQSIVPKNDIKNNRYNATVGELWTFISAIDSGDITHNINSALHVGTAAYAKTTRDNTKYESGTFTADLLTVQCPDNTIVDDMERVRAWIDFISQDCSFILKSIKGDVWVVNIVNSPSRRYDETLNPVFTNITYEWAESQDVNKCVFSK